MKYFNIVKDWVSKKWNGSPWDKFVLLAVILTAITGLLILFN